MSMTENVAEVVDVGSEEEEESKSKGDNLASLLLQNRAPPKEVSWLPPDLRFSQPPGEIGSAPATTPLTTYQVNYIYQVSRFLIFLH
jgi:hypothetical protein